MKPIEMKLARRLGGVGEYYFSKKLREIDRMRASEIYKFHFQFIKDM